MISTIRKTVSTRGKQRNYLPNGCKQSRGNVYTVQEPIMGGYPLRKKNRNRDNIIAVQAERDRQKLRSASRKRETVSTQCKQKETGSIYAVQAEERDMFYAVKKERDVLIKDTLY